MFEFWKRETPEEICTERFILRWYARSLRLCFTVKAWKDIETGTERLDKHLTLNIYYLMHRSTEVRAQIAKMLRAVANEIEKGADQLKEGRTTDVG